MTDQIIDIIIQIAALVLIYFGALLCSTLKKYIKSKLSDSDAEKLDKLIADLTKAAEQTLKADDKDGSARLEYVEEMLIKAGYELTDEVRAIIESKVYSINKGVTA